MQRNVEIINAHDDPEAFMRALEELGRQRADEYRDANAKHVRESLERAAAKRGMHVKEFVATLREDEGYRIFWDWLCVYNGLTRERAKPAPDIALVVERAEELGKLYERLWWRAGVDPDTGKRREVLALREKAAASKRREGGEKNATRAAGPRAMAHRFAREIMANRAKPISGRELARKVHAVWPQGDNRPKLGTVRNYLSDFVAKV